MRESLRAIRGNGSRRARARRALVCGGALATLILLQLNCVSPQIPLPPPELREMALSGTPGHYKIQGNAGAVPAGSSVIVQLRSGSLRGNGVITLARPNGSFETPILEANDGDALEIYYVTTEQRASERACATVVSGATPSLAACRGTSSAVSSDQGGSPDQR